MNPLLFMPSPRDIPEVKRQWHMLPYDKFIVKYKPEFEAYQEAKRYFRDNVQYTHLVICPDDLVIRPYDLQGLISSVKLLPLDIIAGICPVDESSTTTLAIQPLGCNFSRDKPDTTANAWIHESDLPNVDIWQVGHCGFSCQFIPRHVMDLINFQDKGWFDWQFSKQCHDMKMPIFVNLEIRMKHLRTAQKPINDENGYSFLLKA